MKKKYEISTRRIAWSPRFVPQEFVDDLQHAIDQAFNNRQEGLQVRVQQLLHNPLLTNIQDTNTVVKYIYSVPEAEKGIKYRHECMLRIERQEKGYDLQLVRMRLVSDLRKVIKHLRKSLKNNYIPGGEYNFEREAKA